MAVDASEYGSSNYQWNGIDGYGYSFSQWIYIADLSNTIENKKQNYYNVPVNTA